MTLHNFHIHSGQFTHQRYVGLLGFRDFTLLGPRLLHMKEKNIKQNHFLYIICIRVILYILEWNWLKQQLCYFVGYSVYLEWIVWGSASLGNVVACFWSSLLCSLFFCHPWSLVHMPPHCSTLLPHHLASPHGQSLTWYLATKPLVFTFSPCLCLCFLQYIHWKFVLSFIFAVQFQIQRTKPIFTETKMAHGQMSGITFLALGVSTLNTNRFLVCVFPVEMPYFPDVRSNLQRENRRQGTVIPYETHNVP